MATTAEKNLNQIWVDAMADMRSTLGEKTFNTWLSKLGLIELDEKRLRLSAPSNFVRDNVVSRFADSIIKILNSYGCAVDSLDIEVYDGNNADTSKNSKKFNSRLPQDEFDNFKNISVLDKRFTFKNFVVGKPNEFAYAAALRVAESVSTSFNPLFLYGGVGLGKTHLMHAIAWYIIENHPQKKVIYISAEKFMYLFIKSLRFKDAMSFKEMFRNVDVLMIDDVQFIGGKDTTQEEFFHTFNDLVDNNRQVVLSADKSPSDLDGVENRLKSRLGWGLVADIHPANYELRLGILQSKVKRHKTKIPDKVLEFLAMKITSNIRELEGALNRIVAHATLVGRSITIDVAQEVLADLLRANEKFITIDVIQRRVCEFFGVKLSDLNSAKRHKSLAMARHVAMYLCKELTTKSFPDIGRSFGGKDHSTVIHAVKRVKEYATNDGSFAINLEILTKSLES
ncbi:MAG: chromosomal replication initiator protein DnaA [Holosporales bacterium]|jgi:chromosomal replication initiator protein|nr:chromosomal replication initiator protein DnaA [Holosporales bacterium]